VADLRVGNHRGSISQQRVLRSHQSRGFHFGLAREPAYLQEAAVFLDVSKTGDGVDVDQKARSRQAQLHHRDQALAAAQKFGFLAVLLQEGYGFRNALRTEVLKGRRNHRSTSLMSNYPAAALRIPRCPAKGCPYITSRLLLHLEQARWST